MISVKSLFQKLIICWCIYAFFFIMIIDLVSKSQEYRNQTQETFAEVFPEDPEKHTFVEEKFKAVDNETLVIIVQVHKRTEYLSQLILSLSKVRSIADVLLIFSHDVNDAEMNTMIANITFCRVKQIFYPGSI